MKRLTGTEQIELWRLKRDEKLAARKMKREARAAKKPKPLHLHGLPARPPGKRRPAYTFHVVYPKYPSRDALNASLGVS